MQQINQAQIVSELYNRGMLPWSLGLHFLNAYEWLFSQNFKISSTC